MDEERFQKIQEGSKERLQLEKSKVKRYGYASEAPIPVVGKFNAMVETDKKAVPATFIVVKGKTKGEMLLGCDTAMKLGVLKIVNSIDKEDKKLRPVVADIVSECDCLFHGIGKHKHAKIRADESVTPVAQVNRRISYHYQDKLKEQLRKLEEAGVVESVPDDEPTTGISPLVIQPKKAVGEIRICVDMRKPNEAMLREKREFPTVEDIFQELNGAVKFSKLDLNHAYHQLELDFGSRHLTTFSTPWGLKRYTRLNFETVIAQEVFREEVKKTIAGVQGAKNITDGISVYWKIPELHDQALRDTLQKLNFNGLTLNRAKCLFDQSQIEVFGYVFSAEGFSPDPAKFQALREAERPSNAEEVRSFLGMANYSARFIKHFSTLAVPLRGLTRSKVKWRWAEREQEAFMKIKNSLLDNATLAYYEVGAETEVIVDASPVGLGAMLTQKKKDSHRPVTYISRSLSPVEQSYIQREREALAIRWACERFRMYLAGARFKVVRDHKPLEAIFNSFNNTTVEGNSWRMSFPNLTGRSPYSQLFGGREICGKIPQFSLSSEDDPEVRQKDALAKQKMKMYADKKAYAKHTPIREGDMVLLRQEKKNKLSTPFEGIPYTVFQKKGSMVTAERVTDGRMVTRNTKDFKSCPPSTKGRTQATLVDKADDAIVAAKPPSTVDVAEPPSTVDLAEQTSEMTSTSAVPETVPSPHPPSAEEPRYPRRERH